MQFFDARYWNLLWELTRSQFRLKDQSTFFGFLWSFLNPLLMVTVLFAFFSLKLGENIAHYPLYLLIGVIQYNHFSNSTSASMATLCSMKHLTSSTVFPKELLVMGSIIASSIEFLAEMIVVVLIALVSGVTATGSLGLLSVVIALQIALALGGSLLLSCIYVFVRDIQHIYQVFLRILFFATPIFYDPSFLGRGLAQQIVSLNPLTQLINLSREIVIAGKPPPLDMLFLLIVADAAGVYFALLFFRRLEPTFAEHV